MSSSPLHPRAQFIRGPFFWSPGTKEACLLIQISQKLIMSRTREEHFQEYSPRGHNHWLQKNRLRRTNQQTPLVVDRRQRMTTQYPPIQRRGHTSIGFLRLLRSLAILAFLSCFRFFSSRSLSPSLLEELAEALLSNLPRRVELRLYYGDGAP